MLFLFRIAFAYPRYFIIKFAIVKCFPHKSAESPDFPARKFLLDGNVPELYTKGIKTREAYT